MTVSTHRMLLILITMNMVIGALAGAYMDISGTNSIDDMLTQSDLYYDNFNDMYDEAITDGDIITADQTTIKDTTYLSTAGTGSIIFKSLSYGLNPFSILPGQYTTVPEQYIASQRSNITLIA